MSDVSLPNVIAPPTVSTSQVQGNFEALRDFVNGNEWIDTSKYANASITEARMIAGATGLAKGSFNAYRNSATGVAHAAVVVFGAEEWDLSGWYDTTTGRYTPQTAGIYRLTARVVPAAALAADKYLSPRIRINDGSSVNSRRLGVHYQRGSNPPEAGGSVLVQANGSTDYFSVELFQDTGSALTLTTTSGLTYFQGELVGRT